MTSEEIKSIRESQFAFYKTGATIPVSFRISQLKKLYSAIRKYEAEIAQALYADLGKSDYESFMCEIGLTLSEISYMLKNIKSFASSKTVRTPITQFPSRSFIKPIPYGNTLIISPWNYPFLLSMEPLVDAIAAGNTAILKPSAYSPSASEIIAKIISECFPSEYVAVVAGGRQENASLLHQKFDFIFFTGSRSVGKEVLLNAAEHLTPAVLELGGKSPCIVDSDADIRLAAKRIVFGKFLNCGQTCVAPDYILCERSIKDKLIQEVIKQIKSQYGNTPLHNPDYGKIINEKHFERLCRLIDNDKLCYGGETDPSTLKIAPTVMDHVSFDDPVMQEEIFGPVMPILEYDNFDSLMNELKEKEKPLALYIFSENKAHIKRVTDELSYGGGCINDVVIHLATSSMGFGGVGESGMGSYHGKAGFDAFSHQKSVIEKSTRIDLPMRYQPYKSALYKSLLKMLLK